MNILRVFFGSGADHGVGFFVKDDDFFGVFDNFYSNFSVSLLTSNVYFFDLLGHSENLSK